MPTRADHPGRQPGHAKGISAAALRVALRRFDSDAPPDAAAAAAVLAVLRMGRSEVEALLLERAARPNDPASGQIALPGGRREPKDTSVRDTALREFEEEVGLAREDLEQPPRYVGTFAARAFGIDVAAFTAALSPKARSPFARSATEVESVFWLPFSALDRVELVPRRTAGGVVRRFEATMYEGHVVWGFTHRVLRTLGDRLRAE